MPPKGKGGKGAKGAAASGSGDSDKKEKAQKGGTAVKPPVKTKFGYHIIMVEGKK
ncbi:peptidyl-prolyl cis-trans isomerase NIMA-interacting 4-like [Sinocyclocheilus grahami]|uniref:peptidyl-prolyl cis-trans isomerase NIMA-interacting 4-like n=1 Tax=Sinocyclocheilus grahami TaxID=75366 RepID=UPI0007AD4E0C|nr:PREDICTED: peptidyl-prolyl cis-trans isomerase NIMA-interacting 4-like [Sinocyclocheilus grahami]